MSEPYATTQDMTALWRAMTTQETERAEALLPLVSDMIRQAAAERGRDFDKEIAASATLASVAKIVTVDVTARILRQSTTGEPLTTESQSGLGYQWQGTYAIPGGGIGGALMNNDLRRLGLLRQRIGVIDLAHGDDSYTTGAHTDGP